MGRRRLDDGGVALFSGSASTTMASTSKTRCRRASRVQQLRALADGAYREEELRPLAGEQSPMASSRLRRRDVSQRRRFLRPRVRAARWRRPTYAPACGRLMRLRGGLRWRVAAGAPRVAVVWEWGCFPCGGGWVGRGQGRVRIKQAKILPFRPTPLFRAHVKHFYTSRI